MVSLLPDRAATLGAAPPTPPAIVRLLALLSELGYRFTAVTPRTHSLVLGRDKARTARSLRDVFGWNLPFSPEALPSGLFELMLRAQACEQLSTGHWRATLRVASVEHFLFVHSAFPTLARDAVFFGPDSYRFAAAVRRLGASARRAVDVGCGSEPRRWWLTFALHGLGHRRWRRLIAAAD